MDHKAILSQQDVSPMVWARRWVLYAKRHYLPCYNMTGEITWDQWIGNFPHDNLPSLDDIKAIAIESLKPNDLDSSYHLQYAYFQTISDPAKESEAADYLRTFILMHHAYGSILPAERDRLLSALEILTAIPKEPALSL